MLEDFSVVLAGPLKTRLPENLLIDKFEELMAIKKILNFKLIISTYPGELPKYSFDSSTKIIEVADPGSDEFRSGPKHQGYPKRNTTRMLLSVNTGLKKSNTKYSIRTRIELLPELSRIEEFSHTCLAAKNHIDQSIFGIAFMSEHYFGLSRQEKGVHTWLPDTFQIMKTNDMKTIWDTAYQIWDTNKIKWHDRKISFPLANEQIMGLAFLIHLNSYEIAPRIGRFHRFKWDKRLIQYNKLAESKHYYTFKFNSSGLSQSKLNSRFEKRKKIGAELPVFKNHSRFLVFNFWLSHVYNFLKNLGLKKSMEFVNFLTHNSKM
jgi:hypothetical protein